MECKELRIVGEDGKVRARLGLEDNGTTFLYLYGCDTELDPAASLMTHADGSGYVCLDHVPSQGAPGPQRVVMHAGPTTARITVIDADGEPALDVPAGNDTLVSRLREHLARAAVEVLETDEHGFSEREWAAAVAEASESLDNDARRAREEAGELQRG